MKYNHLLLALSLGLAPNLALAAHPAINGSYPDTFTADPSALATVSFIGDNLLPEVGADMSSVNDKDFQLNYRKDGQTMGTWQTASFTQQSSPTVWINSLGNDGFSVTLPTSLTNTPGSIEFNVCIRTVGCSNNFTIKILPATTTGTLSIQGSGTYDIGVPVNGTGGSSSLLNLSITGLTGYNPSLTVNSSPAIEGSGYPDRNAAMFALTTTQIPSPGLYKAFATDSLSGTTDPVFIRAFGFPVLSTAAPKIDERFFLAKPADTSIELDFQNFTGPTQLVIIDNYGTSHTQAVSTQPVTPKTTVAIPAAWLKTGNSQLQITASNLGGTAAPIVVQTSVTGIPVRTPGLLPALHH